MAKFYEVKHIDTDPGPKRLLNAEDVAFLKDLAKEMRTQDSLYTAAPRYFGLMDDVTVWGNEDSYDSTVLIVDDDRSGIKTVDEALESLARHLNRWLESAPLDTEFVVAGKSIQYGSLIVGPASSLSDVLDMADTVVKDICKHFYWAKAERKDVWDAELAYTRKEQRIVRDALFLTQRGAQDYLKKNENAHSPNCHSYCMTAYKSPEVEHLFDILESVDWDKVQCDDVELLIHEYMGDDLEFSRQIRFRVAETDLLDYLRKNDGRRLHQFLDEYDSDDSQAVYDYMKKKGIPMAESVHYSSAVRKDYENLGRPGTMEEFYETWREAARKNS